MKAVAMIFCISCAHLHERVDGSATLHRACQEARDAAVLPRIERLVAKRPPHGYRRITAVLYREGHAAGLPPTTWRAQGEDGAPDTLLRSSA